MSNLCLSSAVNHLIITAKEQIVMLGRRPRKRSNTAQTKNKERRHDITRFGNLAYVPGAEKRLIND